MKRFHYLLLGLIFILTSFAHENETIKKIEEAYQLGKINYEQALLQKFYSGFDRSKLNDEFSVYSQSIQKCATHLIAEFKNNSDKLSDEAIAIIEELISPKVAKSNNSITTSTYISPYQKFELTYTTSGTHRVPSQDLDNNGIPDYVERVAEYFDHSWRVLIDTLGFKTIPLGLGEYYQIGFENMGYYGYTMPDGSNAMSYIVMHNNYIGNFPPNTDPDGNVLGAAKATAVHEFKHAIQFIYTGLKEEPSWFFEADATWAEDIAFDQTNDYYNYLRDSQIREPGRGLAQGSGYEDNLFFHFFTEKYSIHTNREIWERREQFNESVFSSVNNMLANYGAFFDQAFAEYFTWLFNTGNNYNPNLPGFREATFYPTSLHCNLITSLPVESAGCSRDALSGNFLIFDSQNQNKYLQVLLDTPSGNNYAGVLTIYTDGTTNVEFHELSNSTELDLFVQPKLTDIERFVVIPVVTSTTGSGFSYEYKFDAFQTAVFTHTPFSDTESTGDLEFVVSVETPQNLAYIDSLRLFYQVNQNGYQELELNPTGNIDEYSVTISDPGKEIQFDYYFKIADELGEKIFHPHSAPDSAFSFFIGSDLVAPVIVHNSLVGTPKYNFPLYVYSRVTDNIGLDSVYLEYRVNENEWIKEEMIFLGNDIFVSTINLLPEELTTGDLIDYKLTAVDISSNSNVAAKPESNFFRFDVAEGVYLNSYPNIEIREHILASTNDTISVVDEITIEDINIYFKSDHPKFSDLHIRLYDPEGNQYDLFNRDWFETGNEYAGSPSIIFDQDAYFTFDEAVLVDADSATGTFAPIHSDLTQLNGTSALGDWRLRVFDKGINTIKGNWLEWGLIIKGQGTTIVDDKNDALVNEYQLFQNYPNPFNPTTRIKYQVASIEKVSIKVYDILGKEITTLVNEVKSPGTYEVKFNGLNLSSGVYFYTFNAGEFNATKKLILLR